jgi:hypothetical protein
MAAIFAGSVHRLHQDELLDLTVIHGDGTTTRVTATAPESAEVHNWDQRRARSCLYIKC